MIGPLPAAGGTTATPFFLHFFFFLATAADFLPFLHFLAATATGPEDFASVTATEAPKSASARSATTSPFDVLLSESEAMCAG